MNGDRYAACRRRGDGEAQQGPDTMFDALGSRTPAAFTNPPGADPVARGACAGGAPRTARHRAADPVGSAPAAGDW